MSYVALGQLTEEQAAAQGRAFGQALALEQERGARNVTMVLVALSALSVWAYWSRRR